jgi:hypothetical protein
MPRDITKDWQKKVIRKSLKPISETADIMVPMKPPDQPLVRLLNDQLDGYRPLLHKRGNRPIR